MKTKKTSSSSADHPGLTPLPRKKPFLKVLGLILAVLLLIASGWWVRQTQEENRILDEMKKVLTEMYEINEGIFKERGTYSLDFQEIWAKLVHKPSNPSHFIFGFQKNCVSKFASYVQVASQLDPSPAFEGLQWHPRTEAIRDAIAAFLQPQSEEIECIAPREGFLLFAVGARKEGSLDVWIVNHEKTIANIRPDGGASLEGI